MCCFRIKEGAETFTKAKFAGKIVLLRISGIGKENYLGKEIATKKMK